MIKINGVTAKPTDESISEVKPSINEVLERMNNNYEARQVHIQKSEQTANYENTFTEQNGSNSNSLFGNDLLLSLLPMLISNKKANILSSDSPIFKELLKKINNPMLQKIFEMLPNMFKKEAKAQSNSSETENKATKKDIDSFVKTDDYSE